MATHDKDGKRARYFADDDRHDLKSLFEREKLSTAEDQARVCFVLKVNRWFHSSNILQIRYDMKVT